MILNKEQEAALEAIKAWANDEGPSMISLTGCAGSGKTTLIIEVKKYLTNAAYCALTGRAAFRLSEVIGIKATTLHSILYQRPEFEKGGIMVFNSLNNPSMKYLVIDESSLINPKIYEDLKNWNHYYKTRILFVGDSFQLPPILTEKEKKVEPEFSVFAKVKGPELIKVMRSDDGIIDVATIIREQNKIPTKPNSAYSFVQVADPVEYAIDEYLKDPSDHILITWRNKVRMDANHRIRKLLGHTSFLPDIDEPIIFFRNGQNVLNGEIGIVKAIEPGPMIESIITYHITLDDGRVILTSVTGKDDFCDGGSPYVKSWKNYLRALKKHKVSEPIPISYGYCSTGHKSQGSEWRRVSVMLHSNDIKSEYFNADTTLPNGESKSFSIRFLYTALTRAKKYASLIVGI
jgi:ATP-dependent exoDNAse (exonuclease V) alpha subunit